MFFVDNWLLYFFFLMKYSVYMPEPTPDSNLPPSSQDPLHNSPGSSGYSQPPAETELLPASNPNPRQSNKRNLLIGLAIVLLALGGLIYAGVGGQWLKTAVDGPTPSPTGSCAAGTTYCNLEGAADYQCCIDGYQTCEPSLGVCIFLPLSSQSPLPSPSTDPGFCLANRNSSGECALQANNCNEGFDWGLFSNDDPDVISSSPTGGCYCDCYPDTSSSPSPAPSESASPSQTTSPSPSSNSESLCTNPKKPNPCGNEAEKDSGKFTCCSSVDFCHYDTTQSPYPLCLPYPPA